MNTIVSAVTRHAAETEILLPTQVGGLLAAMDRIRDQKTEFRRRSPAQVEATIAAEARSLADAAIEGGDLDAVRSAQAIGEARWQVALAETALPLLAAAEAQLEQRILRTLGQEADTILAALDKRWRKEHRPAVRAAAKQLRGWDLASDVADHVMRSGDVEAMTALGQLSHLEDLNRSGRDLQNALALLLPVPKEFREFRDGPHAGLSRFRLARLVEVAQLATTWFPTREQATAAAAEWQKQHDPATQAEAQRVERGKLDQATRDMYRKPVAVR